MPHLFATKLVFRASVLIREMEDLLKLTLRLEANSKRWTTFLILSIDSSSSSLKRKMSFANS